MRAKKIGRFRRQAVLRFEDVIVAHRATLVYENGVVMVNTNNEQQR